MQTASDDEADEASKKAAGKRLASKKNTVTSTIYYDDEKAIQLAIARSKQGLSLESRALAIRDGKCAGVLKDYLKKHYYRTAVDVSYTTKNYFIVN